MGGDVKAAPIRGKCPNCGILIYICQPLSNHVLVTNRDESLSRPYAGSMVMVFRDENYSTVPR